MKNLRQHVARGLGWSTANQVASQVLSTAVGVALARLLAPRDFGLLGMILMLTGFVRLFMDMGLGAALVQRVQSDERHYSSVWNGLGWRITSENFAPSMMICGYHIFADNLKILHQNSL